MNEQTQERWTFQTATEAIAAAGGSGEFWTEELEADANEAFTWLKEHHDARLASPAQDGGEWTASRLIDLARKRAGWESDALTIGQALIELNTLQQLLDDANEAAGRQANAALDRDRWKQATEDAQRSYKAEITALEAPRLKAIGQERDKIKEAFRQLGPDAYRQRADTPEGGYAADAEA